MGRLETYACDCPGCPAIKKSVNGWYLYARTQDTITFFPLSGNEERLFDAPCAGVETGTLCSKQCAQRVLELFLAYIDVPKPASQPNVNTLILTNEQVLTNE